LHLKKGALLITFLGEAYKAVATRLAGNSIRHDLGRLARGEAVLKQRNQNELINLRTEIADKDGVLGAAVITAIDKSAARSPVELEGASRVGDGGAVEGECLLGSLSGAELDEAIASVAKKNQLAIWRCEPSAASSSEDDLPRVAVADDLDLNILTEQGREDVLDEVLIHPRLHLAHPESLGVLVGRHGGLGQGSILVAVGLRSTAGVASEIRHDADDCASVLYVFW
jgi:hypothetical protein